jgi:hypothetical protein
MATQQYFISDAEIISMIDHENPSGWSHLYDKYALMMYVAVLGVIHDEKIAAEVLALLFIQAKANKSLLRTKKSLCASLLKHACTTALKISDTNEKIPVREDLNNKVFPILNCLAGKPNSLKDAAEIYSISEDEVKTKLRLELNKIRQESPLEHFPQKGRNGFSYNQFDQLNF